MRTINDSGVRWESYLENSCKGTCFTVSRKTFNGMGNKDDSSDHFSISIAEKGNHPQLIETMKREFYLRERFTAVSKLIQRFYIHILQIIVKLQTLCLYIQ